MSQGRPLRIASVVGARPQFVKLGRIDAAIRALADEVGGGVEHIVVHTGQHYSETLSQVFFDELSLPRADTNLGVGSGSHGEQTGRMLEGLDAWLRETKPDVVLTYGDTNSTLAAALAASKQHIPVAHVESGLRSRRKRMPEEVNRVLTDHVSTFLFCPTAAAVRNLDREGFADPILGGEIIPLPFGRYPEAPSADDPWVLNVGDVMYDSILHHSERAADRGYSEPALRSLPASHVVLTVHRAENTDDETKLHGILDAAGAIAKRGTAVVFPVHPRTREAIQRESLEPLLADLIVLEPISYYDMLLLTREAEFVMTDSGGVQREAFMLGRPCVTLREETEWIELLETGLSLLGGTESEAILSAVDRVTDRERQPFGSPYGDGRAAERIICTLLAWWEHVEA